MTTDDKFEILTHPFSGEGQSDIIYDLFLGGVIPNCYSSTARFIPSDSVLELRNSFDLPNSPHQLWLVKNVPEYLELSYTPPGENWKRKQITQYKGYGLLLKD